MLPQHGRNRLWREPFDFPVTLRRQWWRPRSCYGALVRENWSAVWMSMWWRGFVRSWTTQTCRVGAGLQKLFELLTVTLTPPICSLSASNQSLPATILAEPAPALARPALRLTGNLMATIRRTTDSPSIESVSATLRHRRHRSCRRHFLGRHRRLSRRHHCPSRLRR